jgi:hypothetical protein
MPIDPRLDAESLDAIEWLEAPDYESENYYDIRTIGRGSQVNRALFDCVDDHIYCDCHLNEDADGFIDCTGDGYYVNWGSDSWRMTQVVYDPGLGLNKVDIPVVPPEYTDSPVLSVQQLKKLGLMWLSLVLLTRTDQRSAYLGKRDV